MQSKWGSFLESCVNLATSFVVSFAVQAAIFPLFDIHIDHATNAIIVTIFMTIGLVRSYLIRRMFNQWVRSKSTSPPSQSESFWFPST